MEICSAAVLKEYLVFDTPVQADHTFPGQLPNKGWYSSDLSLPPMYNDRMQYMVTARINREQMTEALKLNYRAGQRRLKMAGLEETKVKRRLLQTYSGQPLVGKGSEPSAATWDPSQQLQQSHAPIFGTSGMLPEIATGGSGMKNSSVPRGGPGQVAHQRVLDWGIKSGPPPTSGAAGLSASAASLKSASRIVWPTDTLSKSARPATLLAELQEMMRGVAAQ